MPTPMASPLLVGCSTYSTIVPESARISTATRVHRYWTAVVVGFAGCLSLAVTVIVGVAPSSQGSNVFKTTRLVGRARLSPKHHATPTERVRTARRGFDNLAPLEARQSVPHTPHRQSAHTMHSRVTAAVETKYGRLQSARIASSPVLLSVVACVSAMVGFMGARTRKANQQGNLNGPSCCLKPLEVSSIPNRSNGPNPRLAIAAVSGGCSNPFTLPALPWGMDDLAPHISEETVQAHYGKHHQAHVAKLNEVLVEPEYARWRGKSLEEIVRHSTGVLSDHAIPVWNHNFYWKCLRPNPQALPNPPDGAIKELIDRDFGSFDQFKADFTRACLGRFGSGWVWLTYDGARLRIEPGHDAQSPLKDAQCTPLLACNVSEHAYYADRADARPADECVAGWWHLVDWGFVNATLTPARPEAAAAAPALSALEDLLVGGGAGAIAITLGMPLLTRKFCLQGGIPLPTTLPGWYRGVLVQASSAAPLAAFQMLANGCMMRLISGCSPLSPTPKRALTKPETLAAALSAGVLSALLYTPVDLMTITQQRLGQGLPGAFGHILREHGPAGLVRGAVATSFREGIFVMGMFGLTPIFSTQILAMLSGDPRLKVVSQLVASFLSGTLATFATHPMDTAKSCLQTDMYGHVYRTLPQTLRKLLRDGGVPALFTGVVPRTVLNTTQFFVVCILKAKAEQYKAHVLAQRRRRKRRAIQAA